MAGALALRSGQEAGLRLEVRSAGLLAQPSLGVSAHSVDVMNELGIDISDHLPVQLDRTLVSWTDWIVPMERSQAHRIQQSFPHTAQKLRPLECDIDDPYGEDKETYRECRDRIARAVWLWLEDFKGGG